MDIIAAYRETGTGLAGFHLLLERCHVAWHLLACFPADYERHENRADAVSDEVNADGQPGPGAGKRFDPRHQLQPGSVRPQRGGRCRRW